MPLPDGDALSERLSEIINAIAEEVGSNLTEAVGDFRELVEAWNSVESDGFTGINDALLIILNEVAADVHNFRAEIDEAFDIWASTYRNNTDAMSDLLRRMFAMFAGQEGALRFYLESIVRTMTDFPKIFRAMARQCLTGNSDIRDGVEAILLPLVVAGSSVLGPQAAVDALILTGANKQGALATRWNLEQLAPQSAAAGLLQQHLLHSPAFAMPAGAWIVTLILESLRQASSYTNMLENGLSTPNPLLNATLQPVLEHIGGILSDYILNVDALIEALVTRLLEAAEIDSDIEWLMLWIARFTPVGVLFILIGTATKLTSSPAPWMDLLLNPIESDSSLNVRRLPAPTETTKYLIVSDIHRDADSAARPPFEFGSIDHFLPNADLYLDVIRHYADRGYTIIEAGDCEELWFHRDFSLRPTEYLRQIVQDHDELYELLRHLHADGRYFRIYGNHDSYVREPDTFEVLRQAMESEGAPSFGIYDFIIIEGVKTMGDVPLFRGLDSDPNRDRRPLMVTHGHQWDFWNCDANNILGKLIVSAVVTPLDMLDDPVRDLAGLSRNGSPLVDFKEIISSLPVYGNWKSYEPGTSYLDSIQHMQDQDRRFVDDVQYSETLASLMGLLIRVPPGPSDTTDVFPYLDHDILNLLCIGHTHNPHNEPYYDLKALPLVKEALTGAQEMISEATRGLLDVELGLVKSQYLNPGVAGWHERVISAIDLGEQSHGTGQPKLVVWTGNTRIDRPNNMDWELPHVPGDGGWRIPGIPEATIDDLMATVAAMANSEDQRIVATVSSSVVRPMAEAARKSNPVDLTFDPDTTKPGHWASSAAGQILFQVTAGLLSEEERDFQVSIGLSGQLGDRLAKLMDGKLPGRTRTEHDRLALAISVLAVTDEMCRYGLRKHTGVDLTTESAITGLLMLMASLQDSRDGRVTTELSLSEGRIDARIKFRAGKGTDRDSTHNRTFRRQPSRVATDKPARGLIARAFLADTNHPLHHWRVAVEERTDGSRDPLLDTLTDRRGEAALLVFRTETGTIRIPGQRAGGALDLVLYAPSGQEVIRRQLDTSLTAESVSLPVTFARLREIGLLGRRKRSGRHQDPCDRWAKRLGNSRDPHARADLWLTDLMLDTLAGMHEPKTLLQRKLARAMEGVAPSKELKAAANRAARGRAVLRDCLGEQYVKSDGSGSLSELGWRLIENDERIPNPSAILRALEPNPTTVEAITRKGSGLPDGYVVLLKDCRAALAQGDLPDDIAEPFREVLESGAILAKPSINVVHIWDGGDTGGITVREADIHDKVLTIRTAQGVNGALDVGTQAQNMDVELNSEDCLVERADATGRQIMVTDVKPGQVVTFFGSGFVADKTDIRATVRTWQADLSSGRLVPDDDVLPVDGLSNLELEVHGDPMSVPDNATPTSYNGDQIELVWPDAAAQPGLYALSLRFANESAYPTKIAQDADCAITATQEDVETQEIYFAVLPPVLPAPLRVAVRDVICTDLTDVANLVAIPWPDEITVFANAVRFRIDLAQPDDADVTAAPAQGLPASTLFWGPGTWTPNLQVFPNEQMSGPLPPMESLLVSFEVRELEGPLDVVAMSVLYIAAVAIVALLLVAVVIASIIAIVGTAGLAAPWVAPVIVFIVGTFATALLGLFPLIQGFSDDVVLNGTAVFDGGRLTYLLSPVRFHHLIYPLGSDGSAMPPPLASTMVVEENEMLGGSYDVNLVAQTSGS